MNAHTRRDPGRCGRKAAPLWVLKGSGGSNQQFNPHTNICIRVRARLFCTRDQRSLISGVWARKHRQQESPFNPKRLREGGGQNRKHGPNSFGRQRAPCRTRAAACSRRRRAVHRPAAQLAEGGLDGQPLGGRGLKQAACLATRTVLQHTASVSCQRGSSRLSTIGDPLHPMLPHLQLLAEEEVGPSSQSTTRTSSLAAG